jgi:hypothetical protein
LVAVVGALYIGDQQPDLGNTVSNVIVAAFLDLGETLVTDDLDAQERDSRRWRFEVELLAQQAQFLALFPFFIRIEVRVLKFMIGNGALHSLDYEIAPLLNLRELFGRSHILALFVFFSVDRLRKWRIGLFCSRRAFA